jgi:transposase-like protein
MDKLLYHRHRFPSIVIQQAAGLYFRFALSYRDVEDMAPGNEGSARVAGSRPR